MKITKIVFLISIIALTACVQKKVKEQNGDSNIFPVITVISKDTIVNKEYVADIRAIQNVEIRARVSGFLDRIYIDEGKEVKKGQALFRINDEEYKAELAKARANLTSALAEAKASQLEVDKIKMLVDKKIISKTELDVAEAKLVAAFAKIEEARSAESNASIHLSYANIRSPFNGITDRIPLKVGSLINEGTLLTSVSDVHEVSAYFNVSESEYLHYVKSKTTNPSFNNVTVELLLADGSLYPYKGKIETMEGEFEPSTGSIAFRAKFPNPHKLLKHGASGKIRITSYVKNAVLLPQKCVFEIQDKNYVFVVDSTNKVKMKSFIPQMRLSKFYIVKSGLKPGEKIVYEGIQKMRNGTIIEPELIAIDSLYLNPSSL